MTLPDELQRSFEEQVKRYQEERQMPLLSRMELRAMQQGILQTARESVLEVLEIRFEVVLQELMTLTLPRLKARGILSSFPYGFCQTTYEAGFRQLRRGRAVPER